VRLDRFGQFFGRLGFGPKKIGDAQSRHHMDRLHDKGARPD
jgi:hypothetical protein